MRVARLGWALCDTLKTGLVRLRNVGESAAECGASVDVDGDKQ